MSDKRKAFRLTVKLLQNNVYNNIVSNLDKNNLTLESEEVLEDKSIVLTLNVND